MADKGFIPDAAQEGRVPSAERAPVLTLTAVEAAALRGACQAAGVILEYGSGGSTVMAAGMPDKTIFSVESDRDWLDGLADYLVAHPPVSRVVLHHADIGPTKAWGYPVNDAGYADYHKYPQEVWDRTDFLHPDLVLIDGRFRSECFLTTLYRITRPVKVLWDDYTNREPYHEVERLVRPVAIHGRMAEFHLEPAMIANADLAWIIEQFTRKQ